MTVKISAKYCKLLCLLSLIVLAAGLTAAQAQSTSFEGGTLSWTVSETGGVCGPANPPPYTYDEWNFSSFKFVYEGTTYNLGGSAAWIQDNESTTGCPPDGAEAGTMGAPSVLGLGSACTIVFTPTSSSSGTATLGSGCATSYTGYINPKYMIMGVFYVPPGASSYAEYCNNTSVSKTDSIANTFTSSYKSSLSVSVTENIFSFLKGTETVSYSTTYTQSSKSTQSVTVAQTTSNCVKFPGATNNYVPNNHDYDLIAVWVNPLSVFTFTENSSGTITGTAWNGYGINQLDQPALDIVYIYAGCLNGDSSKMGTGSCTDNLAPLNRTWDTDETWPSGQGPALTATDEANILAADPFGKCTPSANVSPSSYPADNCTISVNPDRFTLTDNEDISYFQPAAGAGPLTTIYTLGYSVADTQSKGYTVTDSLTYGVEDVFQGSGFLAALKVTTGTSQTYTESTEIDQSLTTTDAQTSMASITEPPCTVVSGACSPLYPSTAAPGPTEFDLYEDNLYGTFLFYPADWTD